MTASSPAVPSSFDPAIHLHSEDPAIALPSESFSDELEALNLQRLEKTHNKVVIQHRAWNLSDVFRSDEDIAPNTPTRSCGNHQQTFPSSPPIAKMPFISSPVAFPSSAPSPTEHQKRKNDDQGSGSQPTEPQKRQKIMGGFVEDDDDEADMGAFEEAHLNGQFDIQSGLAEHGGPAELPGLGSSQGPPELAPATEPTSSSINLAGESVPTSRTSPGVIHIRTCSGKKHYIPQRVGRTRVPYERLVASRSTPAPGRAQRSYYGIEIHKLMDEAAKDKEHSDASRSLHRPLIQPSIEPSMAGHGKKMAGAMWTEKYRARKFTDLIGDERTHRSVLRWLKGWDPIVFPGLAKAKPGNSDLPHRKVLLLSGPAGLGKTTLAHVCARQAGYETLEINASDERSRDVVKGKIRDALGTETVKMNTEVSETKVRKVGRPVCVVVDEVDGVVSGSAGGEGGFMKALVDLVHMDQKNAARASDQAGKGRKRKGDNFQFLRPLILICNDVYHPSLRPLRSSSIAEMIHVRQAPLENVVRRMKNVFEREGIPSDVDGVRRLCEASWGLASRRQGSRSSGAEGDIRSVLVSAEWVAHKLRNESASTVKLTRSWLEQRVLGDNSFSKTLTRGGVRDIVDRVFTEGAGFGDAPVDLGSFENHAHESSAALGFSYIKKRQAISRLQEMVDASGEHDRCVADCFSSYPAQVYQDDTLLSKPNAAYDWLHFHDAVSSKVFSNQDWELSPYLSQSVAAFHNLFASPSGKSRVPEKYADEEEEEHPFSGPRADFAALEAQKQNRAIITEFQSSFSAPLARLFRSTESLVTDLVPNLMRMLSPDVKPVLLRGSGEALASVRKEGERALIQSAVRVMVGLGVRFEMVRVENEGSYGGRAYRMEPPLDSLVGFSKIKGPEPVRYAVRRALDQEYRKETTRKQSESMNSNKLHKTAGKSASGRYGDASKNVASAVKRDFFGRVIREPTPPANDSADDSGESQRVKDEASKAGRKVWVSFHDGFSNAVRRPISMGELLAGL